MSNEILEQSSLYHLWVKQATERGIEQGVEQGIEQGIEQGVEQGVAQGIEQGVEQGLRRGALAALHGRFGQLPGDIEQAIAAAPTTALEAILEHAATDTLDQTRARLGL